MRNESVEEVQSLVVHVLRYVFGTLELAIGTADILAVDSEV
jgi:hypothetical protein